MLTTALLALTACAPGVAPGDPAPAFSLEDTNPGSPTYGEQVGQGTVTAHMTVWYFGHAN